MKIKLSFQEKEIMGIGVYRITYQTNIKMEERPDFASIKNKIEERVLSELGASLTEAKEDKAYSMDFIVRKRTELGISVPGDTYTLVITTSGCIKRLVKQMEIVEG